MSEFNLEEYQKKAHGTCQPQCFNDEYLSQGLISEIGEVSGKFKRSIRDNEKLDKGDILKEFGDILWYLIELASFRKALDGFIDIDGLCFHGQDFTALNRHQALTFFNMYCSRYITMDCGESFRSAFSLFHSMCCLFDSNATEVAKMNIKKLADRKKRNQINGSGDNR